MAARPCKRIFQNRKRKLFLRDGWCEGGDWYAMCAFECGTILDWDTASVDHYPIPQRDGGDWSLANLRLACYPCNNNDGGRYYQNSLVTI
jgi:5-methylcytosine-specific restriction endonuclease McrA